jgi:outer membrane protein
MTNLKILSIGFVMLCFVISLKGQTEQGNVLLGGETKLNFTSMNSKWKTDDDNGEYGKTTNLELSPQIGFFVADGLALGVELPVMYSSEKDEDDDKYSTTSFAFAPFLRYYFGTSNVKPYFHGAVGLGSMKMKFDPASGSSADASARMFLYELGGGLGIFLNDKVSLDIGLGYASVSLKPTEDNDVNYKDITSGFGLGIGIVVVL